MATKKYPIQFELRWNDGFEESPCIELKVTNCSDESVTMETVWGYWSHEENLSAAQLLKSQGPTGGSIQWAEEMIDWVANGESKSFYIFGEELHKLIAIAQILSPDLHCLWARINGERLTILDGSMLSYWLDANVVPLLEI